MDPVPPELERAETPVPDLLLAGTEHLIRDVLIVCGTLLAAAAVLGPHPGSAATLYGRQLLLLGLQAGLAGAGLARALRRLRHRLVGAVLLAFLATAPAAIMILALHEWLDPREPLLGWGRLVAGGLQLSAVEALPLGWLIWRPLGGGR